MRKIGLVARREFLATVANKGFVFGVLVVPAMIAVAAVVGPRVMDARSPQVRGEVVVVDPTGAVMPELRTTLAPEAIAARRSENIGRALSQTAPGVAAVPAESVERLLGDVPVLTLVGRSPDARLDEEKAWLLEDGAEPHLAVLVVHPDAVVPADGTGRFGSYDAFVSRALDEATETVVYESMRQAIVAARLRANRLDPAVVEATMQVTRAPATIVAAGGEQQARRGFTRALPFILGILMFVGVMLGGQTLMTSTIEEKSSRVVEVLLAAVSPFDLMAGKLLGQLAVGLLVMAIYIGLGLMALSSFAMLGLVDPVLVVYLIVFFLITYLVFGAMMVAIGAAVNQAAEAQSLMAPVMILLVLPYMMSPMIGRAPNSTFSIALSFIPPVNTLAMMSRLASDAPPPAWQVWLTVAIGLAAVYCAVWFAAKVFRVGLLMHGKPPSVATLIRWAREA